MTRLTAALALVLGLVVLLAGVAGGAGADYAAAGAERRARLRGWQKNPDGSFNLLFGYFNRNWAEEVSVPVGPDNRIEPGGPDRGQPAYFYPRRNRFIFKVRVPADFGDQELVWTLTSNGVTERAYGTLLIDYFVDDTVIMNNKGAGGGGGGQFELAGNQPPELRVEGPATRRVAVGEPLQLSAFASDDGIPTPRAAAQDSVLPARDAGQRVRPVGVVVRVPRRRRRGGVRPAADLRVGGHAGRLELAVGLRLERARGARGRDVEGVGDVRRAGDLHPARLGGRRWADVLR